MKYIIIQTWNGEGYSYSNKAEVKEFAKSTDARNYVIDLLDPDELINATITFNPQEGCVSYEGENQDSGTYQYRLLQEGDYGVVITCNVNEARVVGKEDFEVDLNDAIGDADEGDIETDGENVFIATEDLDYQFIKL
jgi:hypothetical protein